MVEAAVGGLIDLKHAYLDDGKWWSYLRKVCAVLQRKKELTATENRMRYYLAQLSSGTLNSEGTQKVCEAATETYDDLLGQLRPWQGRNAKEKKKQEFVSYRQAYADAFGVDPADPKFKEWEAEQIRKLREADQRS